MNIQANNWNIPVSNLNVQVTNLKIPVTLMLHDVRHVRQFLIHNVFVVVANCLVSSRLAYCNSLFRSLSKLNPPKLQCIQNSAARIVSNISFYISITPVLKQLHWLTVEQCTVFQTPTLVYKFLHTGFSGYFAPYLSSYGISCSTRCSQSCGNFLVIPKLYPFVHKSVTKFGNSFAFVAPTVWNALCASPSLSSFRKQLLSYLYTKPYPPYPII